MHYGLGTIRCSPRGFDMNSARIVRQYYSRDMYYANHPSLHAANMHEENRTCTSYQSPGGNMLLVARRIAQGVFTKRDLERILMPSRN